MCCVCVVCVLCVCCVCVVCVVCVCARGREGERERVTVRRKERWKYEEKGEREKKR